MATIRSRIVRIACISAALLLFFAGTALAEKITPEKIAPEGISSEKIDLKGSSSEKISSEKLSTEVSPSENNFTENSTFESSDREKDVYYFTLENPGLLDISVTDTQGEPADCYSVFYEEAFEITIDSESKESSSAIISSGTVYTAERIDKGFAEMTELEHCFVCGHYRNRAATGAYYVCVEPRTGSPSEYRVDVDFTAEISMADANSTEVKAGFESELNDTAETATVISGGVKCVGNLACEDFDWFVINTKSGTLTMELRTPAADHGDVIADIYDGNMKALGTFNTCDSDFSTRTIKVSEGVTYICLRGDLDCADDYSLKVCFEKPLSRPVMNEITKASDTSVKVSWKDVAGESGYQVYRLIKKDGKYIRRASWKTTRRSKTVAVPRGKGYFKVRAYKKYADGTVIYGPWSEKKSYRRI